MFPDQKEKKNTESKLKEEEKKEKEEEEEEEEEKKAQGNLSIDLLGKRVIKDQALIEYLIEFLLVFVSRKGVKLKKESSNKAGAEAGAEAGAKTDAEAGAKTDAEPGAKAGTKTGTKTDAEVGAKTDVKADDDGRMRFHTNEEVEAEDLTFIAEPRVALRRFLFYENSKLSDHSRMDDLAFRWHQTLLMESDACGSDAVLQAEEDIALVHDLLCSYSAVTRNRGWVAKALLPVCPELVLPDLQGMTRRQKVKVPENLWKRYVLQKEQGTNPNEPNSGKEEDQSGFIRDLDSLFAFGQHNFLARGGQMLYLHVLHALKEREKEDVRKQLESGITNMLRQAGSGTGQLAAWVQDCWQQNITGNITDGDRKKEEAKPRFLHEYTMGCISDSFRFREQHFLDELLCFFRAEIHPVARIELLSQGMVFSLLRAMHVVAAKYCDRKMEKGLETEQEQGKEKEEGTFPGPIWVVDVSGQKGTSNIARQAADSYQEAYHSFLTAMQMIWRKKKKEEEEKEKNVSEKKMDGKEEKNKKEKKLKPLPDAMKTGRECSSDVFKNLGKTMKFIIPPKGRYERFTLPETLVRYLVLALIPPGQVVTLDTFLDRLYSHFGIVIAPEQFRDAVNSGRLKADWSMADYFSENATAFQVFLKRCGFLRDLSDATAIVENPYQEVKMD